MTDPKPDSGAPDAPEFDRKQVIKLLIELGPLIAFFIAYKTLGIFWATGTAMLGTLIMVAISYAMYGHIPVVLMITASVVCIFGGLTFWFNDPRFAYIKPTIINGIFATVLAGGLLRGKSLIKYVFGETLQLTDEGWRTLTVRWALFFAAMASLNEVIWRFMTENTWAYFKFPGMLIVTAIFAVAQTGVIQRSALKPD